MSNIEVDAIKQNDKTTLLLSYAALLLHDCDKKVNEEILNKIFEASNNKIDPVLVKAFVRAIGGK